MKVVVTSIQLRTVWHFFRLANNSRKILSDLRNEKACIAVKSRGLGKTHYLMTMWNDVDAMKKWYVQGPHLRAMKIAGDMAFEISTLTLDADEFPKWKNAIEMLNTRGKKIAYN